MLFDSALKVPEKESSMITSIHIKDRERAKLVNPSNTGKLKQPLGNFECVGHRKCVPEFLLENANETTKLIAWFAIKGKQKLIAWFAIKGKQN